MAQHHDQFAEECVIGCLLIHNECIELLDHPLEEYHFAFEETATIFGKIIAKIRRNELADIATIDADKSLMARCVGAVPSIRGFADYARTTIDGWQRRELASVGGKISNGFTGETVDLINFTTREVERISNQSVSQAVVTDLASACDQVMEQEVSGWSTGFPTLDKATGGWKPGEVTILAARPGMGKTAFALTLAEHACKMEKRVLFISYEMKVGGLAARLACAEIRRRGGEVAINTLRRTENEQVKENFEHVRSSFADLPLFISDNCGRTMEDVTLLLRKMSREQPIDLIIIDYLQLMKASNRYKGNKPAEVGELSNQLKEMALKHGVPVLVLCQLNREVEKRDNKRPQLSDLRWAGEIEQDADLVFFLYREEYYEQQRKPPKWQEDELMHWEARMGEVLNKAELTVAKNRQGPRALVEMRCEIRFNLFSEMNGHAL